MDSGVDTGSCHLREIFNMKREKLGGGQERQRRKGHGKEYLWENK
jgi:hypothetical protein